MDDGNLNLCPYAYRPMVLPTEPSPLPMNMLSGMEWQRSSEAEAIAPALSGVTPVEGYLCTWNLRPNTESQVELFPRMRS